MGLFGQILSSFLPCTSMIIDKNDLHTLMVLVKLRRVNVHTAGQTTSLPIDEQDDESNSN